LSNFSPLRWNILKAKKKIKACCDFFLRENDDADFFSGKKIKERKDLLFQLSTRQNMLQQQRMFSHANVNAQRTHKKY